MASVGGPRRGARGGPGACGAGACGASPGPARSRTPAMGTAGVGACAGEGDSGRRGTGASGACLASGSAEAEARISACTPLLNTPRTGLRRTDCRSGALRWLQVVGGAQPSRPGHSGIWHVICCHPFSNFMAKGDGQGRWPREMAKGDGKLYNGQGPVATACRARSAVD
jgi:hypothetical protein